MRVTKAERIEKIVSILESKNGASIRELAAMFDVSEMTIRRDLKVLENQNVVHVVHGAAIFNNKPYELDEAKDQQASEKRNIGQKAVSLIELNDVIIIDSGTTTEYVARLLPNELPLTVICYTTNTLVEIYQKPAVRIYFAGGYYHRNSQMFEGPEGIELINRVCATKAFISAAGVCDRLGVTCLNQYEVHTKQAAIDSARERILLVDSTKFGKISPSYFADLDAFDTVITDSGIPEEWIEKLADMDITLHLA